MIYRLQFGSRDRLLFATIDFWTRKRALEVARVIGWVLGAGKNNLSGFSDHKLWVEGWRSDTHFVELSVRKFWR